MLLHGMATSTAKPTLTLTLTSTATASRPLAGEVREKPSKGRRRCHHYGDVADHRAVTAPTQPALHSLQLPKESAVGRPGWGPPNHRRLPPPLTVPRAACSRRPCPARSHSTAPSRATAAPPPAEVAGRRRHPPHYPLRRRRCLHHRRRPNRGQRPQQRQFRCRPQRRSCVILQAKTSLPV